MKKYLSKTLMALSISAISTNVAFAVDGTPSVTLFEHNKFNSVVNGAILEVTSSIPKLKDTILGNDKLSSIQVPQGCTATLYENNNFNNNVAGVSQEFTSGVLKLINTDLGNDTVSSVEVSCQPIARGITLFENGRFNGNLAGITEGFGQDDPDLENNAIGINTTTSIKVDEGCSATLYTEKNFGGDSVTITEDTDLRDLTNPAFGHDNVSSIKVSCAPIEPPKVILYHDHNQTGVEQAFPPGEYPSFYNEDIGNNTVSSAHIPEGCSIDIYRDPLFDNDGAGEHSTITLTAGDYNFPFGDPNDINNFIGDNHASSMKVYCGTDSL